MRQFRARCRPRIGSPRGHASGRDLGVPALAPVLAALLGLGAADCQGNRVGDPLASVAGAPEPSNWGGAGRPAAHGAAASTDGGGISGSPGAFSEGGSSGGPVGASGGDGSGSPRGGGSSGPAGFVGAAGSGAAVAGSGGFGASAGVGGSDGSGGAGGAGGSGEGSGGAGAAGASGHCVYALGAEATLVRESDHGPGQRQTGTDRFYWVEWSGSTRRFFRASRAEPDHYQYEFVVASNVDGAEVYASDQAILHWHGGNKAELAYRDLDGAVVASLDGAHIAALGLDGATAYFVDSTNDAIHRWEPPAAPEQLVTLGELGIADSVVWLSPHPNGLFLAGLREMWFADLDTPSSTSVLSIAPGTYDIAALHHGAEGVLVSVGGTYVETEWYVPYSLAGAVELPVAIDALAAPPGCASGAHHWDGEGTLAGGYYVYTAAGGLFSVELSDTDVSTPAPLAHPDLGFRWPEVTGDGTVFAVTEPEPFDVLTYRFAATFPL